jgi:TP901 family phage tail tape measure protein
VSITRDEIIRILLRTEGTEDAAKLRTELGRLVDTTDTAARRNQSFASALDQSKAALVASAAAVYGLVKAFSGAAKASSDLQTAIAAIGTIAADADLDALTAQVQALSREFGGTAATQAKALYEIIAAGVSDSTQAMEVLSTANKLAIGGLADVETAASGLVATLNSYGLAADQATRVSDAFFVAAAAGNATIEELASTIGSVAPLAASVGVSIEELAASVGALTAGGLSTSQAMTQVQSMLTAVVKPTAQAAKAAEELGVNFNTAEIRAKGFTAWLQEVSAAAGGNETVLAQLFGRVEGLQGVLALTGNQADSFAAALSDMTDAAGATERAFERLSDTPAQRMERFRASVDGLKVAIGNVVTALAPVLDGIAAVINAFTQLPVPIQTVIASLGLLTVSTAALTAAWKALAPAVLALSRALGSLRLSLAALGGPIGLVTGALTALVVWFARTKEGAEASSAAMLTMAESLRTLRQAKDEDREATINAIRAQMDSLELTLQLTEAALEQAKAERDAHLERDRSLEVANRTAALEREREKQLQRNVENLEREAAAMRNTAEAARTALDAEDRRLAKAREAQAQLDEQAGGTRELIEAWKTLGLQGDITGQKLTEAGQKMLSALDMVIADARVKGDQLGAALTAGIGKVSTSGELRELQQRLDTLFEQGRISAEQYARVTTELLTKQQALRDEAAKLAGTYRETGRTAEESLRAQIRQWEVLRGNAVATAEAIRQNLAQAMAEGADDGRIQQMQQQLQQTEARAAALNTQIQNANQQLQQTGQQGQQQLQQVSQGFQQVGQAADQAGEQVGRFGRGGAVEELRKAIAAVREEFEALGAEATEFFDKTLLHAARGVNRMGDLFSALNEAATITRQAVVAQQEDVAAQAEQLANLTDESIERMIAAGTTADGLRAKAKRLQEQFTLLGESDLGRLRSALDSAASKLDAITDKAKQARDQLEDMNRQLQEEALREAGREEELAKLRRDRELARIRELAEASGEINSQTAREAMRLVEERYRRELELIRERAREEKRAASEVAREREASAGGASGGRGAGGLGSDRKPQVDKVIRVEIPDVGNVDVVDEDSARALERGLEAVARAARAGRRIG